VKLFILKFRWAASECTNIGATDAKTENQKLLDAVRQLVRERIYHLQTEPEPALPYHSSF
jgi:hypothetical protein